MATSTVSSPQTTQSNSDRSLQLALAAARTAGENHGRDIAVLDVRGQTALFDYFVIATGSSRRQLHAISEDIDHVLEEELNDERMGIEGYRESRWIVLDYGSIVIHIFDEESREFYDLENLWAGATRVDISSVVPEENRANMPASKPATTADASADENLESDSSEAADDA